MDITTYSSSVGYYSPSDCPSSKFTKWKVKVKRFAYFIIELCVGTAISFNFKAITQAGQEQELTAMCYLDTLQEVDDKFANNYAPYYYDLEEIGVKNDDEIEAEFEDDDDITSAVTEETVVDVDDDDLIEAMNNAKAQLHKPCTVISDDDIFEPFLRSEATVDDSNLSEDNIDDEKVASTIVKYLFGNGNAFPSTTSILTNEVEMGYALVDEVFNTLAELIGGKRDKANFSNEPTLFEEEQEVQQGNSEQLHFLGSCPQLEHVTPMEDYLLEEEQLQQHRRLQLSMPARRWKGEWKYSKASSTPMNSASIYMVLTVAGAFIMSAIAVSIVAKTGIFQLSTDKSYLKTTDVSIV